MCFDEAVYLVDGCEYCRATMSHCSLIVSDCRVQCHYPVFTVQESIKSVPDGARNTTSGVID